MGCPNADPAHRSVGLAAAGRWRLDCARSAIWSSGSTRPRRSMPSLSARSPTATWSGGRSPRTGSMRSCTSGALHKPDIERRPREDFIEVNIRGTFNLLEEAVANGVGRFVFTSTTSLMISETIRAGLAGGAARAAWLTEEMVPEPRNIYGVTKLAAEHLCRLYHLQSGLPVIVPAHRAVLPRSRRHGACDRAVGREHQGERVAVSPPDRRGCGRGACRRAREGAGDRVRHFVVSAPTPFSRPIARR